MKSTLAIAYVTWRDSCTLRGWKNREEAEEAAREPNPLIESLGWLIEDNEDQIVLAQSVTQLEIADLLKIPRKMVEEVRTLSSPKEEDD